MPYISFNDFKPLVIFKIVIVCSVVSGQGSSLLQGRSVSEYHERTTNANSKEFSILYVGILLPSLNMFGLGAKDVKFRRPNSGGLLYSVLVGKSV